MAHPADVSRYARTELTVFNVSLASFRAHPLKERRRSRRGGFEANRLRNFLLRIAVLVWVFCTKVSF